MEKRLQVPGDEVAFFEQLKKHAELIKQHRENPVFKDYVLDPMALFNATGTHEIRARDLTGFAKLNLGFCQTCNAATLHRYGVFSSGCVMIHPSQSKRTRCDSCYRYVTRVARVVVYNDAKYDCFCELCVLPQSEERDIQVTALRELAKVRAKKPLDLSNPESIAIASGASSFM